MNPHCAPLPLGEEGAGWAGLGSAEVAGELLQQTQPQLRDRGVGRDGMAQQGHRNPAHDRDRGSVQQLGGLRAHESRTHHDSRAAVDHELGSAVDEQETTVPESGSGSGGSPLPFGGNPFGQNP